jgi:hypothetical protein
MFHVHGLGIVASYPLNGPDGPFIQSITGIFLDLPEIPKIDIYIPHPALVGGCVTRCHSGLNSL